MDSLVRKLVESIKPGHSNTTEKFAFFAPSKVEAKIDESIVEKILEKLSNKDEPASTQNDEGIDLEDSDYKSLKSYISFIISAQVNTKSTARIQALFRGLDTMDGLSLHLKQSVLKLLLMLSAVNDGENVESRPRPMPYSDGMPSFPVFSDRFFDQITPTNNLLYSNPTPIVSDANLSMDSGVFSLPSLPNIKPFTNKDLSTADAPFTFQPSLSSYKDISQYNLSTAFTTTQREANPDRFIRKRKKLPDLPQYISEAPPDVYARYILFQVHKTSLEGALTVIKQPIPTPHNKLIVNALYTLQGIDSDICLMDRRSTTLIVNEFIASETYSTTPLVNIFKKFAYYGSCYSRLERLAAYLQSGNNSMIGKALGFAFNDVLQVFLANIVNVSPPKVMPEDITLLQLIIHFQAFFELLEGLGKIFKCLNPESNTWEPYLVSLPTGLDLLVYLEENTEGIIPTRPLHKIMCYLLTESNKPLLAYMQHWIFHGQILDPTNEFGLEANQEKLACRNEEFWTKGLNFRENINIPSFLNGLEDTLLLCGKSLALLRICDPTLYIINIQPYSELRMKLCPNKLVIREYRRYWNMYMTETIDYLSAVRKREDAEREFDERDRKEAIFKRNEEMRRQSKDLREKQRKIASERKHKLMEDLQTQIREKQESRLQQLKLERELDEYYAAKSGSILETGVERSAPELVEEVKKEMIEKYAVLEQEVLGKIKLAEERRTDVAVKLGIIEGASDDKTKDSEELANDKIAEEVKDKIEVVNDDEEKIQSSNTSQEIEQVKDELTENASEPIRVGLDSLPERIEGLEIDETVIEEEIIPTEKEVIEPVDSPIPKENFYFSLQKCRSESPLLAENPYRVISEETATEEDLAFLKEHESFTAFPVSQLVKLSYLIPIQAQARIVNVFLLDYFRNKLELDNHLTVFRKFVMLENGEFSQSLSLQIFNLLYLPESEQNCFLWYLHLILEKALLAAHVSNLPQVENLVLGYKEQETIPMVTSSSLASEQQQDQLARIVLQLNVGWPLNVVFRSFIHSCYTKIFCFLMYVNRSIWCLGSVTRTLKSLQERLTKPNLNALKQIKCLHLYRHEMQHFVTVLQYYLTNQVLKVSWVSFQARLEKVENIEQLYTEHRNYVNQIMINMALNSKGKPIYIAMKRIFFFIYQLFLRLRESHWTDDESSLNNFKGLKEHYDSHKKFVFLLYKLISKLIANGYSSQLEAFILSINFNEHYAQHNPLI